MTGVQSLITPDDVRRLVRYDAETGRLYWLPRPPEMFPTGRYSTERRAALWNSRWAGREAFTSASHGYRSGLICDRKMQAHRVAWAVIHGRWPNGEIDHINGDRSDNRLANLREVTKRENHRNMAIRSDNTSGVTGVYWAREKGKWAAYIKADKMVALGRYDTFAEAVAARRAAEKVLGYHPNHGRR